MFEHLIRKAIADGGITFRFDKSKNLDDAEEIAGDYWYYPVLPDSTLIVDEQILYEQTKLFISTNASEVFRQNRYVGIWRNPEDKMFYVDINERKQDKDAAIQAVKAINSRSSRQIIAIYNPEKDESLTV
jgi:hypothetical protein